MMMMMAVVGGQYDGDMATSHITAMHREVESSPIWLPQATQTCTNFMLLGTGRYHGAQSSCLDPTICLYVVCMHICTHSQISKKLGTKKHENTSKNTHFDQLCVPWYHMVPAGTKVHKVMLFYAVWYQGAQSYPSSRRGSSSSRDRLSYVHTNNIQTNCVVWYQGAQSWGSVAVISWAGPGGGLGGE